MLASTCTFFLISLDGGSVYAVFVVENDEDDSTNTKADIILIDQKYKSDRFTDNIIGQVKNIGNGTADFVQLTFNLFNKVL